jgi:hypothetical protein
MLFIVALSGAVMIAGTEVGSAGLGTGLALVKAAIVVAIVNTCYERLQTSGSS